MPLMTISTPARPLGFFRRHRPPAWISIAGDSFQTYILYTIIVIPFGSFAFEAPLRIAVICLCIANFVTIMWVPSRRPKKARIAASLLGAYFWTAVFGLTILAVFVFAIVPALFETSRN